jgi:hypothetical protein
LDRRKVDTMRHAAIALAVLAAVLGGIVSSSRAAPSEPQACNLRGSWVAGTAEANRYMSALSPGATEIRLTSGALTATFTRTTFTLGGVGLHLVGKLGGTTIKEEVDIEGVAPYRVRGSRLALGRGTYKVNYVHATITVQGRTKPLRLPSSSVATPGSSVPYSCTPRVLHLTVAPGGTGRGVSLAMQREH